MGPVPSRPVPYAKDTTFDSLQEAIEAIYDREELRGYKYRRSQIVRDCHGLKTQRLRCSCYGPAVHTHNDILDPTRHRQGRTVRTNCNAHVNLNRIGNTEAFRLSTVDNEHNHPPVIPEGGRAQRPPLPAERELISRLAHLHRMDRNLASDIARQELAKFGLEDRQVSNIMNHARAAGRDDVRRLGGDFMTLLKCLQDLNSDGEGWYVDFRINDEGIVTSLFWASPTQRELAQRHPDVLLNDNAFNRNRYQMPLNIGIGIDEYGHSINLW